MAIQKKANGRWQADCQPEGRGGKRVQRTFNTKGEAQRWLTAQKAAADRGEWSPPKRDNRTISQLVHEWYELHGHTLKDHTGRLNYLENTARWLGDPKAINFTAEDWILYRKRRLESPNEQGRQPCARTINHEHTYLNAVFNRLISIKKWTHPNPLKGVPKLRVAEPPLTFLSIEQLKALDAALLQARNPNVRTITRICLATGARWSEAETLEAERIHHGKIEFVDTKNGKNRSIPISRDLESEILSGRPISGRLFVGTNFRAFQEALARAKLKLPKGQLTHILRHTFASHYMINGGDLLKLNKILDHSTIEMTMRYAHLSPEHLEDAVERSALSSLKRSQLD
ncbi:tyrosine-type recombinase/integrase [Microbulbifer sp. ANSA002]|uniref:phage integrase n=1 Tax=unclassified Microbulbifer TaxID=2619833 RepID=UPI00404283E2